eukprot:1745893-Pyramimonas_sp.AAC.1
MTVGGVRISPGDVLTPTRELLNIHTLEVARVPLNITFWRRKVDVNGTRLGMVVHRNPLFSEATGIEPVNMIAVD